jgi:hypothetical protein
MSAQADSPQPEIGARLSLDGAPVNLTLGQALRIERPLDLMRPEYRGLIAEAIVAHATGGKRDEGWGYDADDARAPDVLTADGISVEIKASGDISPRGRPLRAKYEVPKKLQAQVVVLAHLSGPDAMDIGKWLFFIVPAATLRPGQNISLDAARRLVSPVLFQDLATAIAEAARGG